MGDCDLYASFQPFDPSDSQSTRYQAFYVGDDVIVLQQCFTTTTSYILYIMADAYDQSEFRVAVTEMAPLKYRKLSEMTPFQYGYEAVKIFKLECPSQNSTCSSWGLSCNQFWLVFPTEELDPFWRKKLEIIDFVNFFGKLHLLFGALIVQILYYLNLWSMNWKYY